MDGGGDAVQYSTVFFRAERKEPDARAGGDCYTFKSPGSLFQLLAANYFPPFLFPLYRWIL